MELTTAERDLLKKTLDSFFPSELQQAIAAT
jgi:hypothetical protein